MEMIRVISCHRSRMMSIVLPMMIISDLKFHFDHFPRSLSPYATRYTIEDTRGSTARHQCMHDLSSSCSAALVNALL